MAHKVKLRDRSRTPKNASPDIATPPETFRRAEALMPWVVGIIAFLVYLRTMTPGMQMGDGTELAAAAYVLGVPHPTGYPLYMILGKLWLTLTVAGDPIMRLTVLNCIFMAAAAGLTSVIVKDITTLVWRRAASKPLILYSGLVGLITAFLRFHWENAVVTEVYALQFLLTLIFVRIVQKMDMAGGPTRRSLIALTTVFALAMAHHRLSVTLILPWLGIWFWAWRIQKRNQSASTAAPRQVNSRVLVTAALILLAGASLYLYIPLRAAAQPAINWGNATTWSAFYNHVRGTEYLDRGLLKPGLEQQFSASQAREFIFQKSQQILHDLATQFANANRDLIRERSVSLGALFVEIFINGTVGLTLLGLSVAGGVQIWLSRKAIYPLIIAAIAAQNVLILFAYNILDIQDYYLFPFWAVAVGYLGVISRVSPGMFRYVINIIFVGILIFAALHFNYPRANRSNDISAELLSATILPDSTETMPAGSILLTDDDAETFTTWYRQKARGDRPDVLNFAANFVYMPWYKAFFTPEQVRDYKITLAPDVARSAAEYAQQLRTAIIDANIATHPIFTSINDGQVLSALAEQYTIEPVDAVAVTNIALLDEPTTTVLFRIKQKDAPQ